MAVLSKFMCRGIGLVAALAATTIGAEAQSPEQFFKDRQVNIIVGASVGGGYDTYARIVARHLPRHLPGGNANIVVQNMVGAGSVIAMSHLNNVAPKDGSVIAAINPGGVIEPLFNPESAKYDSRKFGWIGSLAKDPEVILAWHEGTVKKFEELFTTEMIVGSTGGTSASAVLPRLLNGVIGTKIKVIGGYQGANDVILAIERRELQGLGSASWLGMRTSQAQLIGDGKLRVLAQYGLGAHPDLKEVPKIIDFAKTDTQKAIFNLMLSRQEIGQPYITPPGVPAPVLAAYRKAFLDMAKDPAFVAELQSRKLDVDAMPGEEAAKIVDTTFSTPQDVVKEANGYVTAK